MLPDCRFPDLLCKTYVSGFQVSRNLESGIWIPEIPDSRFPDLQGLCFQIPDLHDLCFRIPDSQKSKSGNIGRANLDFWNLET